MSVIRICSIACVSAGLAVAAGCGSSSSSPTTTGGSAPAGSSTTPTTTTTSSGGGDSGFCESAKSQIKGVQGELKPLFTLTSTPATIQAQLNLVDQAYQKLVLSAPSQIQPSLVIVYGAWKQLVTQYAKYKYNPVLAGPHIAPIFESAKVKQASATLEAWAKANCKGVG